MSERAAKRSRFTRGFALAYVVALLLVIATFRFVGERNWLVTVALYLPRLGFALPLPLVIGLLWSNGDRFYALVIAVVSAVLITFPLMGYQPRRHGATTARDAGERSIRVMSWNTYEGRVDNEAILRKVIDENPDVFVSQATGHRTKELFRNNPSGYALDTDDEFFLASRFPIVDKSYPPAYPDDPSHHPNFVRYTLSTPFGLVNLFNVHPRSPRSGIEEVRGHGLTTRILDGDAPDPGESIARNTRLRHRQVESLIDAMRQAKHPIIVAGDTNLPPLSWLFHRAFDNLRDGFSEVGGGFGYSFPAKRPWMRIDRILADQSWRFLRFWTGSIVASDHHYVVADLAGAP